MSRRVQIIGWLSVVLLAAVSIFVVRVLTQFGHFTTLTPSFAGTCMAVTGAAGAEDVVIDRARDLVYVSADDRRARQAGEDVRGEIYVLDLKAPERGLAPLTGGVPADFRPHGLDLYTDPETGAQRLFVVSHPDAGDRIEIFDMEPREGGPPRLVHAASVTDPLIRTPNDVAAAGRDAFYVTNDHRAGAHGRETFWEDLFRKDATDLVYVGGGAARVADDGLTYPNGVAVDHDRNTVYVTETLDFRLRIYDRDPETGALTLRPEAEGLVFLGTAPDNIDVSPDGSLWIAAHPKSLQFFRHAMSADNIAPSQVLLVSKNPDGPGGTVDQVYLNAGEELSGASVAAAHDGKMVMGAVFDPKILVCDLPEIPGEMARQRAAMPLEQ